MMLRPALMGLTFAIASAVAAGPAAALTVTATDPTAEFLVGTGVINTLETVGGSGDATVLPGSPFGASSELHLELQLVGAEEPFTFGTQFTGTADAVPDLYILESGNPIPLLTADVIAAPVTNLVGGPAGSTLTSVNLGGFGIGQSELTLTGGSLVDDFGGIGATAALAILINAPSEPFAFGSTFDLDFTAQMNIQLELTETVPEPTTASLLGLSILGVAIWQRRSHQGRIQNR